MYLVIIIGAGNIGSRHLQAFAKAKQKTSIIVIDPSQNSLNVCQSRWNEANNFNNIVDVRFQSDYLNIPKEIDLVIISTNSEHRFGALEKIVQTCVCKNILLEKFLFSSEDEYVKASLLIEKYKPKVYVNLVKRTFEAYRFVQKELSTAQGCISMSVSGNNWGMASNSIHFMDLFCYLSHEDIKTCNFLDSASVKVINSKREGYIEFIGNLFAETNRGSKLNIICNEGDYNEINILIEKVDLKILIKEQENGISVHNLKDNTNQKFNYPFQSQLTLRYFTEFMENKPSLTTYNEAFKNHLLFLQAVKNLLSNKKNEQVWKIT